MPMAWIEPAAQAPRQYGNDPPLSKCPEPIAIVGMGENLALITSISAKDRLLMTSSRMSISRRCLRSL